MHFPIHITLMDVALCAASGLPGGSPLAVLSSSSRRVLSLLSAISNSTVTKVGRPGLRALSPLLTSSTGATSSTAGHADKAWQCKQEHTTNSSSAQACSSMLQLAATCQGHRIFFVSGGTLCPPQHRVHELISQLRAPQFPGKQRR
jgi:hypothetical protein